MKNLYLLMLLAMILVTACSSDYQPVPTESKLAWVDADGIAHVMALPDSIGGIRSMNTLPDGRLLILSDRFKIYSKLTNTTVSLETSDILIPGMGNIYSLSSQGDAVYYSSNGKICRKRIAGGTEEVLVDSTGVTYYSPSISKDGRYLAFMCKNGEYSWEWQGYPLYVDLQTGLVHSLKTGDENLDRGVTDCWVDHLSGKMMFSTHPAYSAYHLNSMNLDGTGRAIVTEIIYLAELSADGRYLLPRGSSYNGRYYRDNQTMLWKSISDKTGVVLSRTANLIYYYVWDEKKVYQENLETGEKIMIFNKYIIPKRKIIGVGHITPNWNDDGLFAILSLRIEDGKETEN